MKRNARLLDHARGMRSDPTPPEDKLWLFLRAHRLGGLKFRRQHPIGPFIVDFFCAEAGVVVELDGDSHGPERRATDVVRQAWLESQGLVVWRCWNTEFAANIVGALEAIEALCRRRIAEKDRVRESDDSHDPSPRSTGARGPVRGRRAAPALVRLTSGL